MITKVVMPKLSDAMETGKVIKWLKKEGDAIKGGDVIAEVETDKANVEIEAFGAGRAPQDRWWARAGRCRWATSSAVIAEPADDINSLIASAPAAPAPAAPASGAAAKPADIPPAAAPGPVPATETYKSAPATDNGRAAHPESGAPRPQPVPSPAQATPSPPQATPGPPQATMVTAAAAPTGPRLIATGTPRRLALGRAGSGRSHQGLAAGEEGRRPVRRGSRPAARSGPGGRIIRRDVEAALAALPPPAGGPAAAAAPAPAAAARARRSSFPRGRRPNTRMCRSRPCARPSPSACRCPRRRCRTSTSPPKSPWTGRGSCARS